jgi:hypothetical protein
MSLALKPTSGLYLVKPCCFTSLWLTVLKKYQFSPASTMRINTLETLSQTLLMFTNVCDTGGTMCDGIQMMKTATLMLVIKATVPHFSFATVLRCSAMRAIRLMIICINS